MKESNKPLFPEADRYLLIGDATALSVISTIIEQLPKGVKADAIIEVTEQDDEVSLYSLANVNIKWIFNPHPEQGSKLAELTKIIKLPNSKISRFAFLAGEYDTIKKLRSFFKNEKGWNSNEIYSCAYWKSGESENQSSTTRKTESDENKD
jgi:NADPH-dependent ferric siderophore reductase